MVAGRITRSQGLGWFKDKRTGFLEDLARHFSPGSDFNLIHLWDLRQGYFSAQHKATQLNSGQVFGGEASATECQRCSAPIITSTEGHPDFFFDFISILTKGTRFLHRIQRPSPVCRSESFILIYRKSCRANLTLLSYKPYFNRTSSNISKTNLLFI